MEALLFTHDGKLFLAMRGGPYMTPALDLTPALDRQRPPQMGLLGSSSTLLARKREGTTLPTKTPATHA